MASMTPLGSGPGQSSTPPLGSSSDSIPLIQSSPDTDSTDPQTGATNDTRVLIWPVGSSFGGLPNVTRILNDDIMKSRWPEKATNWTSTPQQTRDLWWQEFQRRFRWDPMQKLEIYKIFKKKAGNGMRNAVNKAKQKNMKPSWMSTASWKTLQDEWENEKYKKKVETNKKNRASDIGSVTTYAGGSIDVVEHARRLQAKSPNRKIEFPKIFQDCYQKKDKSWTGTRAQQVLNTFQELLAEQTQLVQESTADGASHLSIDQSQLWVKAAGGVKNGRVFGMGPMARPYVLGASSPAAMSSGPSQADMERDAEMQYLREELRRKDETMATMKQQLDGLTESFAYLREKFVTLRRQNQSNTSS